MRDHADPAADELVAFAEASVGAHRRDDPDQRKVIALAEHLELHEAAEVCRHPVLALLVARIWRSVIEWCRYAGDAKSFGYPGNLFGVAFAERRKRYAWFHRIQKLAL